MILYIQDLYIKSGWEPEGIFWLSFLGSGCYFHPPCSKPCWDEDKQRTFPQLTVSKYRACHVLGPYSHTTGPHIRPPHYSDSHWYWPRKVESALFMYQWTSEDKYIELFILAKIYFHNLVKANFIFSQSNSLSFYIYTGTPSMFFN